MRIVVSHVTFGYGPTYARGAMASNKATRKKECTWTNDEAELLLNVTHDYKIKHLTDGTCWESVRLKYGDILDLYKKELPRNEEEAQLHTIFLALTHFFIIANQCLVHKQQ